MKKILALIVFLFVILAPAAFGQTDAMLDLRSYSSLFLSSTGNVPRTYTRPASNEDVERIAALGGSETSIDTPLEIALLSNSAGVVDVRPAEANQMLGTPRQADLKLGSAVFMEMQILRFLGNTNAVGRHEGELRFITDRGNVTRAEIETFYRNGIRTLISSTVDEEFNRVSFLLENSRTFSSARDHNAVLTRNPQNGHYTLTYGGAYTNNETRIITANSLEALSHEMRNGNNRADFDETGINAVRTQAGLIPAMTLSDTALNEAINILVNFYINPSPENYNLVKDWYVIYSMTGLSTGNERYIYLQRSTESLLAELNEALKQRILADTSR